MFLVILLAMIGAQIHATTAYWIVYGLYVLARVINLKVSINNWGFKFY